jgi:hypothetical protein
MRSVVEEALRSSIAGYQRAGLELPYASADGNGLQPAFRDADCARRNGRWGTLLPIDGPWGTHVPIAGGSWATSPQKLRGRSDL